MMTRRNMFQSVAAGSLLTATGGAASRIETRINELEARVQRRDFKNLMKEDLPTPCLILDEALFEKNMQTMAAHSRATGLHIRPHVKIHKCHEISKRQVSIGAIGACCATIAECELIHAAGVKGILFTCQPAGKNKIMRAVAIAKRDSTFHVVADDPITVDLLDQAAGAAGTRMNVVVDVYAGLTRQGAQPGETSLKIAQKVASSKNLKFAGLMAYSGAASHTKGFEARRQKSMADLAGMLETAEMCKKSGLAVGLKTGGSTGTYNIDPGHLTELQCGSYIFMDTGYRKIGGKSSPDVYSDFDAALTVLSTVVSKTRPGQCTIDYGRKAMIQPTDEVKGRSGVRVENQGAEYGMLHWESGPDYKLGERVELVLSNLDNSTHIYDRLYVARGEQIVDVWPIMGRSGAASR